MPETGDVQRMHKAVYALSKLLTHRFVQNQSSREDLDPLCHEHMAAAQVDEQRKAAVTQILHAMAPEIRRHIQGTLTCAPAWSTD